MAKYHVNLETGAVGVCRAKPGNCLFGSDSPHYDSKEEGLRAYESSMKEANLLEPFKKKRVKNPDSILKSVSVQVEMLSPEDLTTYINSSAEVHGAIDKIIDARAKNANAYHRNIQKFNPKNPGSEVTADEETYKILSKSLYEYRDRSAQIVDAYTASDFYKPLTKTLEDDSFIGVARKLESLSPNTVEWVQARHNRIGASDVSTLAMIDFTEPDKLPGWAHTAIANVEKSKIKVEDPRNIRKVNSMRSGALYIGRVWEDRIRDDFVKENPEYTVYNAKSQYQHPENEWQVINLDGVMSDRKDGKPNCLLEIKTGSFPDDWKNGVPVGYRAQVLYALDTTDLDYAIVEARVNDGERFTYRIEKGEEISPGSGISMKQYLENRITPWFEDLKSKRSSNPE